MAANELARYMSFLGLGPGGVPLSSSVEPSRIAGMHEQVRTAPLFTWQVKEAAERAGIALPQYALLGKERFADVRAGSVGSTESDGDTSSDSNEDENESDEPANDTESNNSGCDIKPDNASDGTESPTSVRSDENAPFNAERPVFLNTNAPWSAFICGSQGGGKSHTLSCILEGCLLKDRRIGKLAEQLSGIIFHYDNHSSRNICEAATLCSTPIRVRVLVSDTNFENLSQSYRSLKGGKRIEVLPLKFKQRDLNIQRMKKLMAVSKEGHLPLYMEIITRILRDMALTTKLGRGFDYLDLKKRIEEEDLSRDQMKFVKMRLSLLDSYMDFSPGEGLNRKGFFDAEPGMLTIVDLTDPLVDVSAACSLFDVCLGLFLEGKKATGKVIALDEAHKFLTETEAADDFTNSLLTCIREQRHQAVRVIVATQEPTISPKLLDLCSFSIIHRFNSPNWLVALRSHLAGASSFANGNNSSDAEFLKRLFEEIVSLNTGEALVFAPSGILNMSGSKFKKLETKILRLKTRARISADGGESKLAVQLGQ